MLMPEIVKLSILKYRVIIYIDIMIFIYVGLIAINNISKTGGQLPPPDCILKKKKQDR